MVAGFNEVCVLGFKVTGLVLRPDKAGILGNRGLGIEAADIAEIGDDAGGVDLANARDGGQGVRDEFELLFNGLIQHLDLLLQGAHGCNGNSHCLIDDNNYRLRHAVRTSCGSTGGIRT